MTDGQCTENPAATTIHLTNQQRALTRKPTGRDDRVKIDADPEDAMTALLRKRREKK